MLLRSQELIIEQADLRTTGLSRLSAPAGPTLLTARSGGCRRVAGCSRAATLDREAATTL